jgi:hypothetical protein
VARRTNHHVAVSVGRLPCNRPQTPSVHYRKGQQSEVRRPAPLSVRLVEQRVGVLEALHRNASLRACRKRRWCHAGKVWVEASWESLQALWISASWCQEPMTIPDAVPAKAAPQTRWTSDLVSPPVPFLQPPAKSPPCPRLFPVSPSKPPPPPSSGFPTCALITQPVPSFSPRVPPAYL